MRSEDGIGERFGVLDRMILRGGAFKPRTRPLIASLAYMVDGTMTETLPDESFRAGEERIEPVVRAVSGG